MYQTCISYHYICLPAVCTGQLDWSLYVMVDMVMCIGSSNDTCLIQVCMQYLVWLRNTCMPKQAFGCMCQKYSHMQWSKHVPDVCAICTHVYSEPLLVLYWYCYSEICHQTCLLTCTIFFILFLKDGRVCRLSYSVLSERLDLTKSEPKA